MEEGVTNLMTPSKNYKRIEPFAVKVNLQVEEVDLLPTHCSQSL
jgi:hypothetical protein